MDGDGRILYMPMENRAREFDARILFSLVAANANFQVVLGPKWLFGSNIGLLPRGLYATKTLNKLDADELRLALKHGHTTIAWDEEGPGQIVPDIYLKGVDDEAVSRAQRIYVWGEHQAVVMSRKYPNARNNIQVFGNPRWDLLRPELRGFFAPEAADLRAKYGRFILVNTNFSTYNSALSEAAIASVAHDTGAFEKGDASDQDILRDIIDFERKNFEAYATLLPSLSAAFPQHTIVIRPHPTENHQRWKDLAASYSNIRTIYEGMVVPWLLAAEAVIQNSCTTGVEALTLGRPVVSYCGAASPLHDLHLSNEVCMRVHDKATLIDLLGAFIADPTSFSEAQATGRRALAKHIASLDGETSTAAIVKSLIFFANKREKQGAHFDRMFAMPKGFQPYNMDKYKRLKFPAVSAVDIQEKVSRFSQIRPATAAIAISQIHESCFLFRRAST